MTIEYSSEQTISNIYFIGLKIFFIKKLPAASSQKFNYKKKLIIRVRPLGIVVAIVI